MNRLIRMFSPSRGGGGSTPSDFGPSPSQTAGARASPPSEGSIGSTSGSGQVGSDHRPRFNPFDDSWERTGGPARDHFPDFDEAMHLKEHESSEETPEECRRSDLTIGTLARDHAVDISLPSSGPESQHPSDPERDRETEMRCQRFFAEHPSSSDEGRAPIVDAVKPREDTVIDTTLSSSSATGTDGSEPDMAEMYRQLHQQVQRYDELTIESDDGGAAESQGAVAHRSVQTDIDGPAFAAWSAERENLSGVTPAELLSQPPPQDPETRPYTEALGPQAAAKESGTTGKERGRAQGQGSSREANRGRGGDRQRPGMAQPHGEASCIPEFCMYCGQRLAQEIQKLMALGIQHCDIPQRRRLSCSECYSDHSRASSLQGSFHQAAKLPDVGLVGQVAQTPTAGSHMIPRNLFPPSSGGPQMSFRPSAQPSSAARPRAPLSVLTPNLQGFAPPGLTRHMPKGHATPRVHSPGIQQLLRPTAPASLASRWNAASLAGWVQGVSTHPPTDTGRAAARESADYTHLSPMFAYGGTGRSPQPWQRMPR